VTALQFLYNLAALDEDGLLTRLGRRMAEFPLEPSMSKMLLTSVELGCSQEVLSIVSMLSIPTPFFRPKDKQAQADSKRAQFFAAEGDHFLLLNVYEAFQKHAQSHAWAHDQFLQGRSLRQAGEIRKQLVSIFDRYHFPIVSCGAKKEPIQRSVVSAYFMHAAKKSSDGEGYQSITDGQPVYIHPSSTLFHAQPQYVVYHQLVLTVKEYMRECIAVHPNWLVEHAPKFFKTLPKDQQSKRKKREKIQPLFDPHHAKDEWRLRNR
jgi:ATP-dependent RNA helicase DHX8/PRP22